MPRVARYSALLIALVVSLTANADDVSRRIVGMHGGRDFALRDEGQTYQGLLARELAQQAMLIAARDELGCTTRDIHLGQNVPENAIHVDIVGVHGSAPGKGPPTRLEILAGPPPTQALVAAEEFQPKTPIGIVTLVEDFEKRSRGSFVAYLRMAGLEPAVSRSNSTASVPDDVSSLLSEMSFITQFRAACALHAEIAKRGHSPALLAALVRAYANLGALTDLHWSCAHKVFTARSLLYAQRLVVEQRDFSQALTARAYAYAMAGLHSAALEDLDALEKLAFRGRAQTGELAVILRDYCRFRFDLLDPARFAPENQELVRLLRCLAREQGSSYRKSVEDSIEGSKALPHCYRIQASLAKLAGVSLGHSVTSTGPAITARTLYPRLLSMSELPEDVRDAVRAALPPPGPPLADRLGLPDVDPAAEFPERAKVIASLLTAKSQVGEQDELTWPVLGSLLAEHSFQEVWRRAYFLREQLNVPLDAWLDVARPLYEKHRMAPMMEYYRLSPDLVSQAIRQAAKIDLDTIEIQSGQVAVVRVHPATPASDRRWIEVSTICVNHCDRTMSDLARRYSSVQRQIQRSDSEAMYALSPHAPMARNSMVFYHWDKVQPQLPKWLKEAEGDSSQFAAIGRHFAEDKQYDKAIELLRKACDLSPELSSLQWLAYCYRVQGKITQWQAALEDFLQQPDYGLQHARVQCEIAEYYMSRHEWNKALPWARAAAEGSFAGWALLEEAACHEALGEWTEAEETYKAESERYDDLALFYFTRRTGKGDIAGAEARAKALLTGPLGEREDAWDHVGFALLNGDKEGARERLEGMYEKQPGAATGLFIALLADERKDSARRDAVLKEITDAAHKRAGKGPLTGLAALADILVQDLRSGGQGAIDAKTFDQTWRVAPTNERGALAYLGARYLDRHGKAADARRIWLYCMSWLAITDWNRTLAGAELLAHGAGPVDYQTALQTVVDAPPPQSPPEEMPKENTPKQNDD